MIWRWLITLSGSCCNSTTTSSSRHQQLCWSLFGRLECANCWERVVDLSVNVACSFRDLKLHLSSYEKLISVYNTPQFRHHPRNYIISDFITIFFLITVPIKTTRKKTFETKNVLHKMEITEGPLKLLNQCKDTHKRIKVTKFKLQIVFFCFALNVLEDHTLSII